MYTNSYIHFYYSNTLYLSSHGVAPCETYQLRNWNHNQNDKIDE